MDADEHRLNTIPEAVIGAGFLEKAYERALIAELALRAFQAMSQVPISVFYKGMEVGHCFCDVLVENEVIVEVKHTSGIDDAHLAQVLNYLKATGKKPASSSTSENQE